MKKFNDYDSFVRPAFCETSYGMKCRCVWWLVALLLMPLSLQATDIDVADANGNVLRYSYSGTGDASLTSLVSVSENEVLAGHIIIPATITDADEVAHNVTAIASSAFSSKTAVLTVSVGANVTSIGGYAFDGCKNLTEVTGGAAVTSLGNYSFRNTAITTAFLPQALRTIGTGAFFDTPLKVIEFGPNVQSISESQFRNYSSTNIYAERIVFNGTYTTIPSAFCRYYPRLKEVVFGDNIKEIESSAFYGAPIEELTLPEGLTTIGGSAFYNCDSLRSVVIPDNVTSLGSSAFCSCDSLHKVVIGDKVTSVGGYAFDACRSLTEVTGGEAVTSIGNYSFRGTAITTAFLPQAVQTIGTGAFFETPLKLIEFGPNVQSIGESQFRNYSSTNIYVERIVFNGTYTTIPSAFCRYYPRLKEVVFGNNIKEIESSAFYGAPIEELNLPEGLTTIGSSAFYNCDSLRSVVIPDNVTSLGSSAFCSCDSLHKVVIGAKVTAIGGYTFDACRSLTEVTGGEAVSSIGNYSFRGTAITTAFLPQAVQTIGTGAFFETPLKLIEFGPNVQSIGESQFRNYSSTNLYVERIVFNGTYTTIPSAFCRYYPRLKEVVFGNNIKEIESSAFYGAPIRELTLPEGLTTIGSSAFYNCDSLRSVVLPNSLTSLGNSAFYSCDSLKTVALGSGLQTIGSQCFYNDYVLETVTGGEALKTLNNNAFYNCYKLKAFDGHNSLETIGSYAFYNCYNMETLTGLEAVKTLSYYALQYCSKLTELTFGTALTSFDYQSGYTSSYGPSGLRYLTLPCAANPFTSSGTNGLPDGLLIYVPEDLLETYRSNSTYARFRFMAIGAESDFAIITTEGGQLQEKIEEKGGKADEVMELKVVGPINGTDIDYIHRYLTNIEVLDLGEAQIVNGGDSYHRWKHSGNTSTQYQSSSYNTAENVVGSFMFANLTGLRKLVLPAGVTSIGSYAFSDCGRLTEITIPDGVTSIGSYAFSYSFDSGKCPRPTTLTLPSQLTSIGSYAFYYMKAPQSIEIPAGVETINEYTFANSGIRNVTFNEGLKTIAHYAFQSSSVQHVNLPSTLESMGENVFQSSSLREITFPESLKNVPYYACYNCSNLKEVTFNGQETIEHSAFYNCSNLTTIHFSEGLKTIDYEGFYNCQNLLQAQLPQSLKTIGNYAFRECLRMEEVTLPDGLESLGNYAFSNCDSLTTFTFPEAITIVPEYVLQYCDKLSEINLASGVRRISGYAFDGCKNLKSFDFDRYTKLNQIYGYSFRSTGLTEVDLPDRIDTLYRAAFSSCKSLTRAKMPAGVDYVASDLFNGCEALTEVVMHDGINRINSDAFNGCKSLPTIELNDGIVTIGDDAFSGCVLLELPNRLLPPNLTTVNSDAFYNCSKLQLDAYPEGLTEIQSSAFRGCTSLTNGNLPTGLKKLDNCAFESSGLTSVVIPEGITTFGQYVFRNCKSLVDVTWPADQKVIPSYTFYGCNKLADPNLPDAVTEIGYLAFYNCNFPTFHFPKSLQTIGQEAFEYAYGLTEIELPISLKTIKSYAFRGTKLRHVEIPDSLTTLEGQAFENCDSLRTAHLGRSMNYGTGNNYFTYFYDCDSLKLLRIFAGTPPTIPSNSYISKYYKNCVLEVPAGVDSLYREAAYWKDFKEIRTFLTGDKLDAVDYAIMKRLYELWDGDNWTKKWDLETDDRFVGKWYGVTFEGDHISKINLTGNNLRGPLTHDVFDLPALTSLDLGNNYLTGKIDTVLADDFADAKMTRVQLYGNQLEGDLYPFAAKFSALTYLSVAYNQLTAISQAIPKTTLQSAGNNLWFNNQFCDYKTQLPFVSEKYPARQLRFGEPFVIEWNSLQTYDHSSQNYSRSNTSLYKMYCSNGSWTYDSPVYYKLSGDQYIVGTNSVLYPVRGEAMLLTPSTSSAYMTPIVVQFDWADGDVNADLTVDVTDLQNIVYYAMNYSKLSGKAFNYTAANAINDQYIDVRDVVACVNGILAFEEPEEPAPVRAYLRNNYAEARNGIAIEGDRLCLANADNVAALQLTILNQVADDLSLTSDVSGFRLATRQIGNNTRVIIYDVNGGTINAGEHALLRGLGPDAAISNVRLSDANADYLEVAVRDLVTALQLVNGGLPVGSEVFDLSGRRIPSLDDAPSGVYVIKQGNKQFKVRK